jgi:putative hydrolase of HD superfamily
MKILDFALVLGKLKNIKRTGWIREKILNPESIAEHSYRMAVLAMVLAPKVGANTDRSIKMALIHDIGEAEVGDTVTARGIKVLSNLQGKITSERNALANISSLIDDKEYTQLFDEFEDDQTKEAQLVKQIDKLEMAIQAFEYEQKHKLDLQEFFDNAKPKVINEELKKIMDDILTRRKDNATK